MASKSIDRLHKHIWKIGRWIKQRRSLVRQHPVLWQQSIADSNLHAICIAQAGDINSGYHWHGNEWWSNSKCPHAFQYPDLNALYSDAYFVPTESTHPMSHIAADLVGYMCSIYKDIFNKQLSSVLELGSGGGEITAQFQLRGLDFLAVEGTTGGVNRLKQLGIADERIVYSDIKKLNPLGRKFDIVMCTEVAEHIEPWFASKVVEACIAHSDVIWFSAAIGNRRPAYDHINEVPLFAWDNIFAHLGYPISIELDHRHDRADRLYLSASLSSIIQAQ